MIWDSYLKFVQENTPWKIATQWILFSKQAIQNIDTNHVCYQKYINVVERLLAAIKNQDAKSIDLIAEIVEPKNSINDESFLTDEFIHEFDETSLSAQRMAVLGFASCFAVLSAWDKINYKSAAWDDNRDMSTYPEIIDFIKNEGYLEVFESIFLSTSP